IREKDGLKAKIELCTTTRQVRIDTLALVANWLKDVGIEAVSNPVDATNIFDLAEHAFTSSIDPLGNYFNYHSSQFDPAGVNDAQVKDPEIDASMDAV